MATTSEVFLTSVHTPHAETTDHEEILASLPPLKEFENEKDENESVANSFEYAGSDADSKSEGSVRIENGAENDHEEEQAQDSGIHEDPEPVPQRPQSQTLKQWLENLGADSDEYDTDLEDDFPPGG